MAHAGAMRHLVKAIWGRYGSDLERGEKEIETRVAGHGFSLNDHSITE
jgi:hypothetical protein